jgi:hypothetical protein
MFTTADGGYGFIGNDAFGDWRVYDPPQIHLPGNARPGMSWEEDYKLGSDAKHRSYRIDAFARCVGHAVGVTVVQLSRTASGTTVEARQDYCEGVGMVGADVMVTRTNGTVRRSRIEPDTAAPK